MVLSTSSAAQLLVSTPPVTRATTAALLLLSGAEKWAWWTGRRTWVQYICVVPGSSIWFPWTFITAGFVESSFLGLLFALLFVTPSLRYFERLWGSLELVKFILVVTVSSYLVAFFLNWIEFVVLSNADLFLYGMPYCSSMALQTGLLVAFMQLMPEYQVQLFGAFGIRVKHLPMMYVTLSTVLCLLGFQSPWILIQFGWLFSWVYLRFYKRTPPDISGVETYGDRSETFAFVNWFPPFAHYLVSLLADAVFNLALRLHLIRGYASSAADLEAGTFPQTPGGARAEAERRRAMALKALDQHMSLNSSTAPAAAASDPQNSSASGGESPATHSKLDDSTPS